MFTLPTKNADRVAVLDHLRSEAEEIARPLQVQWLINYWWMAGARYIDANYQTGEVTAVFRRRKDDDLPPVRYEDVVAKQQAEMGRLLRMDIRPSAARRGFGLDAIRRASAARVLLDYLTSNVDFDVLKYHLVHMLLTYGTVGVGSWARSSERGPNEEMANVGETGRIYRGAQESRLVMELIAPWELYSAPARITSPLEVTAVLRRRWVTMDWLKSRPGLTIPQDRNRLRIRQSPYGVRPDSGRILGTPELAGAESFHSQPANVDAAKINTDYVLLEEWFGLHQEQDRLASWTVKAGDAILRHEAYDDRSVYMPLGICRYYPLGGFYGRSLVELLQPLNAEQEQMAARIFQIVKDTDAYGTNLVPSTWQVSKKEITDHRKRNKVVFYDPDPAAPDLKVQGIPPITINDFPGKVLSFANTMMDRLAQQSPIYQGQAAGRVDSMVGLSFLHEVGSTPLAVPANAIANGLAQCYKEILAAAPELLSGKNNLPLVGLDDNIMGLQIDPNTGYVSLKADNYPAPSEVMIGIKDKLPAPTMVREQKLVEMLKMQIITPTEFRFTVWKENLDLPVGNWAEEENYRKAILQCLTLFGDGQTPGQTLGGEETDIFEIHLMVIQAFMSKAEFQFASIEVRQAFEQMKAWYMGKLGRYPEAMPYPEQAAAVMGGGGPPPGGPPPGGPPMAMPPPPM